MSYTERLLIEIRDRSYGQQQTPAAGCRPASDQAPLRQAMSTTCRIVPATLPQRGTRRTPLKTSVSISETLFLVPSSLGWRSSGAEGLGHPGAVAGAGGLLPDGAGAGLDAFGLVELALVEEAGGERVLAGQVRADAEVAGGLAGDHGVLVVAEYRLDLLHLPRELLRRLAGRRAGGLGRVAGAAGRLAGLVQGDVPGLAAWRLAGPAHPPARLPVRLARGGGEEFAGGGAGRRAQRRVESQLVQVAQQFGVAFGVEGLDDDLAGGGPPGGVVALDPRLDRADEQFHRDRLQAGQQVPGQHLAVAGLAEQAAEPLERRGSLRGPGPRDDRAERAQGGAQPAGGHAHLVDGVELVGAHRGLERAQRRDLDLQVGRRPPGRPRRRLRPGSGQGHRPR